MLQIKLLCHGTLKEDYLRMACAEYVKRLGAYCKFSLYEAKDDASFAAWLSAPAQQKDYKIALCVEGKQDSSEEFAERIEKLASSGVSSIVFVIGASDGIPESMKAMCQYRLSFSRMTFPHQLMRVILLEQIYRAMNIRSGGKYHK
jgi:23S rRNA (pseudouridine1915-N3)-methyltransferase